MGSIFSAPVQIDPGAHPDSYAVGIDSLSQGNSAEAWLLPPLKSCAEVQESV